MSSLFVWWLFSCSPVPKVSVFLMCLCCKFRFEGKYDDSSNSMLHPAVLTDLFLFYMWGSSLSISVLYRYLIIKSNSDPHPHFLLACSVLVFPTLTCIAIFVRSSAPVHATGLCSNIMNIRRWYYHILNSRLWWHRRRFELFRPVAKPFWNSMQWSHHPIYSNEKLKRSRPYFACQDGSNHLRIMVYLSSDFSLL